MEQEGQSPLVQRNFAAKNQTLMLDYGLMLIIIIVLVLLFIVGWYLDAEENPNLQNMTWASFWMVLIVACVKSFKLVRQTNFS